MAAHGEPEVALSAVRDMLQEHHVELLRSMEEGFLMLIESLVQTSTSLHQVPSSEPASPCSKESSRSSLKKATGFSSAPLYARDKDSAEIRDRDREEYEDAQRLAEERSQTREENDISRTKSIITKWGSMSVEENTWRAWLYTMLSSWQFEVTLAVLIFLNAAFLGVQTEASSHDGGSPLFFELVSVMFTLIFVAELLLRMAVMQWYFFSVDVGWNLMDTFIVVSSTLELVMAASISSDDSDVGSASAGATSGLRILRIVRVTRLLRVLRVVRVVRFIRALRTLVYSIVCTLRSLAWSMLLLVLIIYVFSILLTDAVSSHFALKETGEVPGQFEAELELRFGSLHRSMQTLFQCIAGGLSWAPAYLALEEISLIWGYLFLVYVSFCYFAVLNVMTGVFCHSAIQSANRDHELAMQAIWQDKERYANTLQGIFEKMDADKNGKVNIKEFQSHFDDHEVRGLFSALELDASDAWTLFRALDADGSHELMAQEFLDGCMSLRGFAKSIDVASFRHDSRHWYLDMMKAIRQLQASCQRSDGTVNIPSIEEMQKRLKEAFHQLNSLQTPSKSDTTSTEIPTDPVGVPASNRSSGVSHGGEESVLV